MEGRVVCAITAALLKHIRRADFYKQKRVIKRQKSLWAISGRMEQMKVFQSFLLRKPK